MAEPIEPQAQSTEESSAATEVYNSVKVSLADLCAKGTAQYAHKNYEEASDCYARASELQAELNGEMNPENADILFLYGRSLFKVGQSKSDVLGGKAGGEKKPSNGKPKKEEPTTTEKELDRIVEEQVAVVAEKNGDVTKSDDVLGAKKPLFQFTGDENFDDSDDEDKGEGEAGEAEGEEEEDDLAAAFEVLDLTRVLFTKRLEEPTDEAEKGKATGDSSMTKHIKERLADTHDLLAEISLENERFPGAVTDFRSALDIKKELYPEESEIIAEAHFKLSLALEFASITHSKEENEDANPIQESEAQVDQAMRDDAIKELEAALNSTKLKLGNKEVELASSSSPDDNDVTRAQIADVKEIVADMEGRLVELKGPAIDMKAALYSGTNSMSGILGTTIGESPADAAARIEEAKKSANDLTGLVRRKKDPKGLDTSTLEPQNEALHGKRKAEDDGDAHDSDSTKKAKVEDDVN